MDAYERYKETKEVHRDYCVCLKGEELAKLMDFRDSGVKGIEEKIFKLANKINEYSTKKQEKNRIFRYNRNF